MYYKSAFSQVCLASESFHLAKLRFGGLRTDGPSLVSGQYTSVGVYTLEVDERLLKAFCPTRLVLIGELIQGASAREQGGKKACGCAAAHSLATDTHLLACATIRDCQAGG